MKKFISLPIVLLLALVASDASALFNHFHEGKPNWFVQAVIGGAPSIFSSHRAHQMLVVPYAGVDSTLCTGVETCNVNNFANVLQETPCLPKFGDMFRQGLLHVGVQVGRDICDRSQCFLEFTYNRASGKCYTYCNNPFVTCAANVGCAVSTGCGTLNSTSCSTSCNDSCSPSCTTSLSDISSWVDSYDDYQAFGGFIGARHFTNRFWCDAMSFWYGYKVGIMHRDSVNACTNIVYNTTGIVGAGGGTCVSDTVEQTFARAVFCKSNTVSGGLQVGFDYCHNDRLSFQLGFEVVASAGLRGNRNHPIDIAALSCGDVPFTNDVRAPSNIIVSNTGAVLNFPIWLGINWEFGSCLSSCMKRCD